MRPMLSINGTVTSVIYGCREFFKVASVNQYSEKEEKGEEE